MSLINKMLRDLDARHAVAGRTAMPNEVRPLPEQTPRPRVSRGLLGLLALTAIAAVAGLQTSSYWLPELQALLAPPVATPQPPPPVVQEQAPPMLVLALPSVSETLPLPPEPQAEPSPAPLPAAPRPPRKAAQAAQAAPADGRNSGLKMDNSLPQVSAAPSPAPVVVEKSEAEPAPRSVKAASHVVIDKQQHLGSAQERAEFDYRKGLALFKQGHATEAMAQFKSALQEDPRHTAARQTLLSMLAEQKQWDEVQALLNEGLELMPTQVAWAMALARIQVERDKPTEAWETLQKYMADGEKNADYQGFAGVVLQRLQKPREATLRYQAALQLRPNEGRWWLGLGMALESDGHAAQAKNAFRRARSADGLTPEMLAVIENRLQ